MKKTVIKILKFLAFFAISAFIFWLIYGRKEPEEIDKIKETLKSGVNYWWVVLSLFIGLVSHISRSIRWEIMIEPVSHKPKFINTFMAVMIGYLMNLAFPRMGEISRCGVLSRYEKISFTKLLGTVVAERLIDMISLLILLVIVIASQFGQALRFLQQNPEIKDKLSGIILSPVLIGGFIGILVVAFIFRNTFKQTKIYKKIQAILINFKEGFISIRNINRKGWFWFHSVFIWFCYYLMLYVTFFAFDFTSNLNPIAGLTTFVLASFGMVAPVQGGIGAWHFMAREALALYNVERLNGETFALLAHTSMTLMIILLGIISMISLSFINGKGNKDKTNYTEKPEIIVE